MESIRAVERRAGQSNCWVSRNGTITWLQRQRKTFPSPLVEIILVFAKKVRIGGRLVHRSTSRTGYGPCLRSPPSAEARSTPCSARISVRIALHDQRIGALRQRDERRSVRDLDGQFGLPFGLLGFDLRVGEVGLVPTRESVALRHVPAVESDSVGSAPTPSARGLLVSRDRHRSALPYPPSRQLRTRSNQVSPSASFFLNRCRSRRAARCFRGAGLRVRQVRWCCNPLVGVALRAGTGRTGYPRFQLCRFGPLTSCCTDI